jgi:Trypsin-like peptidase domain
MNDDRPKIPFPPELPGEAAPGRYGIKTADGVPAEPGYAIFPIVRYEEGKIHLIGTGFFITTGGIFVTAAHVLKDVLDAKGHQKYPIGILQFVPGNVFIQRPIVRSAFHPKADVTVGVAAPMQKGTDPLVNPVLTLTATPVALETRVMTYAYPKHLNIVDDGRQFIHVAPTFYDGYIKEYFPKGRDKIMLPGPCYRSNMIIHGGASGGPVFCPSGAVFGVNSTGYDGCDISFISAIDPIFDLAIDEVQMGSGPPRTVPVIHMARAGHVVVKPPLATYDRTKYFAGTA